MAEGLAPNEAAPDAAGRVAAPEALGKGDAARAARLETIIDLLYQASAKE
jgi:hypothetical protein